MHAKVPLVQTKLYCDRDMKSSIDSSFLRQIGSSRMSDHGVLGHVMRSDNAEDIKQCPWTRLSEDPSAPTNQSSCLRIDRSQICYTSCMLHTQ